ncbi:MAG: methionyl aminopeptidase [Anaerolineae bacterium]|nr:methionyl aminopeptidase [Anaerolineae bacterium]
MNDERRYPLQKLSRNDLCWCGSGKKYKHCHLRLDQEQERAKRRGETVPERRVILKTPEQIAGIRESCRLTKAILDMLETRVEPDITTEQIDRWVHEMTVENGAIPAPLNYRGYPKSVCTSLNEVVCHGIPGPRVLKEGDILNIDVTSILNGYYGDSSRMFLVGEVSEAARKLVDVTYECMMLGIEQVKPGNRLGDIGHAIQRHAESRGYSVVRAFVGHGTGIHFHEPPDVHHYGQPGTGMPLAPNMVFTIEPMINAGGYAVRVLPDGWTAVTADGSLSAQWEHTILVTEEGVEILTA